jgi:drug/metabolite transporter (DMT)-like permease
MVIVSLPIAAPILTMPELPLTWLALFALVITGSIRGVADIEAYRYADSALLTPVTYLRLIFIGIGGYAFFAENIDGPTLIGAVIIIASTLYIAQRERAKKTT